MKNIIGENIRRYRAARGFTQNELAILLSVSPQAVSRWENGQAFPDISMLTPIAKFLNVSIDELMGTEVQRNRMLSDELYEIKNSAKDGEALSIEKQLRCLDIYEELGRSQSFYLWQYFREIIKYKNDERLAPYITDERVSASRQMIRSRMKELDIRERVKLLSMIVLYEEEDKLETWKDGYEFPLEIESSLWDELLLPRYVSKASEEEIKKHRQKILYDQIKKTCYYITEGVLYRKYPSFRDAQYFKTAIDTIELYSSRVDDIFIYSRILADLGYAEALFANGQTEESFKAFELFKEHLCVLRDIPDGSVLCGSVPVLDTLTLKVTSESKFAYCVIRLDGFWMDPMYEKVRFEPLFTEMRKLTMGFRPDACDPSGLRDNIDVPDDKWRELLERAMREAKGENKDPYVTVLLMANGDIHACKYSDYEAAALKIIIQLKASGCTKIERIVHLWCGGALDLPSYALREAILDLNEENYSAQFLTCGHTKYRICTVEQLMPKRNNVF